MLTAKQMTTKIGGIRKSSEAIRKNVHEVLCNASGHVFEHKDASFFTRLIDATSGVNQTRIKDWIRDNGLATWDKKTSQYKTNKKARLAKLEEFQDAHEFCLHLFTNVPQWFEKKEDNDEKEKKDFDVKAWAARQYNAHPDQLDAMIKELAKYKEKAKLDLVA